jgi:hypothetical protein
VLDEADLAAPEDVTFRHVDLRWSGFATSGGQVAALATIGGPPDYLDPPPSQVIADYRERSFRTGPTFGSAPGEGHDLPANTRGLILRSGCAGGGAPPACQTTQSIYARFEAWRVAVSAEDDLAPSGTATGDLLTAPVVTGAQTITVNASDRGAGLYAARLVVDGQAQGNAAFGDRFCRDVDPGNSDPFEFAVLRPCPLQGSADLQLDTTGVSDDAFHQVQVQVLDAAGNTTTLADRIVGVDAKPPLPGFFDPATRHFQNPLLDLAAPRAVNGMDGGDGAAVRVYFPLTRTVPTRRHRGSRRVTHAAVFRTVSFHARPTLRARLTNAVRQPIARAKVWIASRVQGGEWRIDGKPRITSAKGGIGLRLPSWSPSREVNVVYFPYSDSHGQALGRPVRLKVRAGVTLAVDRARVRNRRRVRFSGRVAGPLGDGGVAVSLQVRLGSRFHTFRSLRVTQAGAGRFRTRYRFEATTHPTRYTFRAIVSKQTGLPYERGISPTRTILVGP